MNADSAKTYNKERVLCIYHSPIKKKAIEANKERCRILYLEALYTRLFFLYPEHQKDSRDWLLASIKVYF